MSSAAKWSLTATATLWANTGRAAWGGGPSWAVPVTLPCDYAADARKARDARGDEYSTREVIYTERADIKPGDRILIGASAVTDPIAAGAREVRSVMRYGDVFERKADDFLVGTI